MPTYEFKCPNGHAFDRFYKNISDAPSERTCPECGAVAERQVSGGAGLLFKGSGFYLTDYGKNAHRNQEPKAESGKAETAKSEGGEGGGTKAESGKPDSPKLDVSKAKTESPKPKSEGAKPKKE